MGNSESESKYTFFWEFTPNLISPENTHFWIPYDQGDCYFLEKKFQLFLQNKKSEVCFLETPSKSKIDFKHWVKFDADEIERPITREVPSNITNIVRFDRFAADLLHQGQPIIKMIDQDNRIDTVRCKRFGYQLTSFEIIPKQEVEFLISDHLHYPSDGMIKDYEFALLSLKSEIMNIAETSKFQNSQNPYSYEKELKALKKSNFYETILRIYNLEGFLYKEINHRLRSFQNQEMHTIHLFCKALMASIAFYSQGSLLRLKELKIIKEGDSNLLLYCGGGISQSEIDCYQECRNFFVVRCALEFLSTTYDKNKAEWFMNNNCKSTLKALYEIEFPIDEYLQENSMVLLERFSDFPAEKECLIKSGSLLKVQEIIQQKENVFLVKLRLISVGWKGVCELLEKNFKGEKIGFAFNKFESLESDEMKHLSRGLSMNKTITTLDLKCCYLGTAKSENMRILGEALINNETITTLDLSGNIFERGIPENLEILLDAINKNQNIKNLKLSYNNFGNGKPEVLKILNEFLASNHTLSILDLSCNELGSGQPENIRVLSEGLGRNQTITTLTLSENQLGGGLPENFNFLMHALSKNEIITNLDLAKNRLGIGKLEYMRILGDTLINNQIIKILNLTKNDFSHRTPQEILKILGEVIIKNQTITSLNLSENSFGYLEPENLKIFCDDLMKNQSLNIIDLSLNNLGDNSLGDLALKMKILI